MEEWNIGLLEYWTLPASLCSLRSALCALPKSIIKL